MAEATTGDACTQDKDVNNENWMSTNEMRWGQNWPRRAEAITNDACIMNKDRSRRAYENSTSELCCKMNENRGKRDYVYFARS